MLYFANPSARYKNNKKTEINLLDKFLKSKQYILSKHLDIFEKILVNLSDLNVQ